MISRTRTAAIFGASGVLLGAFGAHGLKAVLESHSAIGLWQTASLYHLLHAVVLLCLASRADVRHMAFRLFTFGILLFSGSLYVLALTSIKPLGAVTPLGGLLLIAGWIALCFPNRSNEPDR
jgi:uncharacterized membrane protein YgdD (TMEM256/DUF423 family)